MRAFSPTLARGILLPLALLAALAGCDDDAETAADAAMQPPDTATATWHQDVAPIVMTQCATCHVAGGVAPFPLDSYESARNMSAPALAAIEAGRMPPWMPGTECRTFANARVLSPAEKDTFRAWVEAGAPEGDPATAAPIDLPEPVTFEPTDTVVPDEPYTPPDDVEDDYRCFILSREFPEDTYLRASQVYPDATAIVHHVLVYSMTADQVPGLLEADAADEGPGYACFGSPLPDGTGDLLNRGRAGMPNQVGNWVPGASPWLIPDNQSVRIEAGSRIVMQVHYNLLAAPPEPDQTRMDMRLTNEPTELLTYQRPLMVRTLDIPAGEANVSQSLDFKNYGNAPVTITGLGAHMHLLATEQHSTVHRADGSEECLLSIDDWDFAWQEHYELPEDGWVSLAPGDTITLECVFDNSAGNQPFVDGRRIEPRDVGWGDGTLDEMCMLYMTMVRPYEPAEVSEAACAPAATTCVDACAAEGVPSAECLIRCGGGPVCTLCALQSTAGCGAADCAPTLVALRENPCLQTCFLTVNMLGGDPTLCLQERCPEAFGALSTCLSGVIDTGNCDAPIEETCGLRMHR
ncbi:MAG: hypothetical protein KC620_11270 [Myxococcales bacterium]|nr:hypothetical protein [Myxococcales bacterium]